MRVSRKRLDLSEEGPHCFGMLALRNIAIDCLSARVGWFAVSDRKED
jgi:hypothetical protein